MAGSKVINPEQKQKAIDAALEFMNSGCNCAESTIRGLISAEIIDMPTNIAHKVLCSFGSGGGRAGLSCGALCAGMVALNWEFGREDPFVIENPKDRSAQLGEYIYVYTNNFVKRFVDSNGTALCKEVIERNGNYFSEDRAKDCFKIVKSAVEHVCDMMELSEEELKVLPPGYTILSIGAEEKN